MPCLRFRGFIVVMYYSMGIKRREITLFVLLSAVFLFLSACDLIEYHPYDVRVKGEKINRRNMERIESAFRDSDTIRFVLMGDSQRWYDETEACVSHINKRNDVDFVIHGGDISDFGMPKEFEWVRDIMSNLKVPYVAVIGNHDIIGNGAEVFEKMYGEENYSFIAGKTKFICMNTNALEFDYSHPVPNFEFIYSELRDTVSYGKTVAVMHTKPEDEQFNNNVKLPFHELMKRFPNLQFCLHAHNHSTQITDVFDDGVMYYGCACMKKRSYLYFVLTPEGYSYEEVEF